MAAGKQNTCKPSSLQKRMMRQMKGIEKHLEVHPNDKLSVARVSTIRTLIREGA